MVDTRMEYSKKIQTGYYVIGYDKLRSIENKQYDEENFENFEDGINPYDDASVFLHGSCQLFALALHKKYGYTALNLKTKDNINAHYFCKENYNGRIFYIDIRGITEDLNEVIIEFTHGNNNYKIDLYDFLDEKILNKGDAHGIKFAEKIIEDNPDFYDVKRLKDRIS